LEWFDNYIKVIRASEMQMVGYRLENRPGSDRLRNRINSEIAA